jgi:hypothetical protein
VEGFLAEAFHIVACIESEQVDFGLVADFVGEVFDFDNKTGDAVFDDALKRALAVELEQSPFLNVLSDRKVSETLGMMGRPTNDRVTLDVGREICLRTGSKAHLQLGRALAMAGDTAKAKNAYQDFFSLWKEADTDIPILKDAKAEYAKLQ